jgi:DNA-binding beta-propeller fold protein YncE
MGVRGCIRSAAGIAIAFVACVLSLAPAAGASQRAYFADHGFTSKITAFSLTADGGLTALPTSATAGANGLEGITISPDGQDLFAAAENSKLYRFGLDSTGALSPGPSSPLTVGTSPYGVVVSPNGHYVYVANRDSSTVQGFSFAAGGWGLVAGSPATVSNPTGLAISPDGRHLYVARLDDKLSVFSLGDTGGLTSIAGSPFPTGAQPYAISMTPDGTHLYLPSREPTPKVYGYSLAPDGTPTALAGPPPPVGGANPFGSTITPDGRFLYTANADSASISAFAIAADGSLTPVAGSPFTFPGAVPSALTPNAAGTRLYMIDNAGSSAAVLSISPSGALTAISGSPFPTGVAGDFESVALTPARPPTAAFTSKTVNGKVVFDGTGSTDPDGTVARYDWDFGDGETLTDGGPHPKHRYADGEYLHATLTVTDDDGCSTRYIASGQTAYCSGSASARTERFVDARKPRVSLNSSKFTDKMVSVRFFCSRDQYCTAKATAKLKLKGAKIKPTSAATLRSSSVRAREDQVKKLKMKLSPKARAALADASSASAKLVVTAKDDSGNVGTATRGVKFGR